MPTTKEFLTAFLGKTLNLPAEKVAELLNSEGTELNADALDKVLALDATRVAAFKAENDTHFKNGQAKATKEILTDREKEIKEKFAITSDKKGVELIEEIITIKAGAAVSMEPDKVKLHPTFIAMQDDLTKKLNDTTKDLTTKYETLEKTHTKEKIFSGVVKNAEAVLSKLKPILPSDATKAANQKQLLLNELNQFDYIEQDGKILITDKAGKVVEDGHGNRKNFESIVTEAATKYWDFEDGTERGGSGGSNDGNNGGAGGTTKWKGAVPKTDAEFQTAFANTKNDGRFKGAIINPFKKPYPSRRALTS